MPWPREKDYLHKPKASEMGIPPIAAKGQIVKGVKKGKPA